MPDTKTNTETAQTTVTTENKPVTGKPASDNTGKPASDNKAIIVASSVGALAGLGYAFYKKKGFWGYVGFFVLGSIAGSLVGNVVKPK